MNYEILSGSKFEEYKISEITMKDNKYLLFSENRNLKINMVDGRMVAFVLGKKYSAIWKEKIVEVLSSQMQMFQEHKKEEKPQYEIILSGVPINIEMYKDTLGIRKLNEKINYQNPQQASMVLERINSGQMFLSLVGRKFGERINAIQNGNDDIKFCIVCHSSLGKNLIICDNCNEAQAIKKEVKQIDDKKLPTKEITKVEPIDNPNTNVTKKKKMKKWIGIVVAVVIILGIISNIYTEDSRFTQKEFIEQVTNRYNETDWELRDTEFEDTYQLWYKGVSYPILCTVALDKSDNVSFISIISGDATDYFYDCVGLAFVVLKVINPSLSDDEANDLLFNKIANNGEYVSDGITYSYGYSSYGTEKKGFSFTLEYEN